MKNILVKTGLMILVGTFCSFSEAPVTDDAPVYHVGKLKKPMKIDADWNKAQWKNVRSINITNYMGTVPEFKPETQVKMLYDNDYVYVIFHVKDRYVKCITDRINGPVWQDSAVEFFFAPDPRLQGSRRRASLDHR